MGYEKTLWKTGDVVTEEKMNKIEQGIKSGKLDNIIDANNGGIIEGLLTIGDIDNPEWADPVNPNTATGENAHVEGGFVYYQQIPDPSVGGYYISNENVASGKCSHAEGAKNTASGDFSHAEGQYNIANYIYTHAEGFNTTASSEAAHAEGSHTVASGYNSHAEGSWTEATGTATHAEGSYAKATASYAHAEGEMCIASGMRSHAQNSSTKATAESSHAEGGYTEANGVGSHAEGGYTKANGNYSHASGSGTIADGYAQTVIGVGNIAQGTANSKSSTDYAFIIGNGDGVTKSNAFAIKWDGTFVLADGTEISPAKFGQLLNGLNNLISVKARKALIDCLVNTVYSNEESASCIKTLQNELGNNKTNVWFYKFEDSIKSCGLKDFYFKGDYAFDTRGDSKVYYREASSDCLYATGIKDVPNFSNDFTLSFWGKKNDAYCYFFMSQKCLSTSYSTIPRLAFESESIREGWTYTSYGLHKRYCSLDIFWENGLSIRLYSSDCTKATGYKFTPPENFDGEAWHHYALTRKNGTLRFFIDGEIIFIVTDFVEPIYVSDQISLGTGFVENEVESPKKTTQYQAIYLDDLYINDNECLFDSQFNPAQIDYGL